MPPTPGATWGIAPPVRAAIKSKVLALRAELEDDYAKQLAALGISKNAVLPVPADRPLSPPDARVREVALAAVASGMADGSTLAEALTRFLRDSAFTFLNRMVGLRCMEERSLLLVDGQPETAIRADPARGASSLYWQQRRAGGGASVRDLWRTTIRRACLAVSQQVGVLFDPDAEYAALFPRTATVLSVVAALNAPEVPAETYAADELLGWVYQYYNSAEKDAVYARLSKGKKLERPEEIAAATCLYTERYMVDYLLQNTLGALWLELHPESRLPAHWPYYVRPPEGEPRQVREPRRLRDITLLDPACGSGHFLVRAFDLLADMYREEGIEAAAEVANLIVERNLHGIDIDLRAIQIAALGLYLKGCALAGPGFRPRTLNLIPADAILPPEPPAAFLARYRNDKDAEALIRSIWRGLQHVREFGSLLHPERAVDEELQRRRLQPVLSDAADQDLQTWKANLLHGLREEFEREAQSEDLGRRLFGEEAAKGISLVEALGRKYDVVVANPPYAGSRNLKPALSQFLQGEYGDAKADLYAAFIVRCEDFSRRNGFVGMVTQQSWMFLSSFSRLRHHCLEAMTVTVLAHLGTRAFEEISGEVVSVVLFVLRVSAPTPSHRLTAARVLSPKSVQEKQWMLQQSAEGLLANVLSMPKQNAFLTIQDSPLAYWLPDKVFQILAGRKMVADVASVVAGLSTGDNERFTRGYWECSGLDRWVPYEKGGGYMKWDGLRHWSVDWSERGAAIRTYAGSAVRAESRYFLPGLTYTGLAQGSVGVRLLHGGSIFAVNSSSGVFPHADGSRSELAAVLNCRFSSYLLRSILPKMQISEAYFCRLVLPRVVPATVKVVASACIALKQSLISHDPTERSFAGVTLESDRTPSTHSACFTKTRREAHDGSERQVSLGWGASRDEWIVASLHTFEGLNERLVFDAYELDEGDLQSVLDETGTPAGWHPLIAEYDVLPEAPADVEIPEALYNYVAAQHRQTPSASDLARLKDRLRALYRAGPGAKVPEEAAAPKDEDGAEIVPGGYLPIPTETFLEELSQKLRVHPISVYRLLEEMREQEGLVSPPELKRQLEDYASVSVLRLLGYRWPEQDAYEQEHGPLLPAELVDDDGIIPLVACGEQPTAEQLLQRRLETEFGEQGAAQSETEFRQWVGRDLGDWLRRDFFKRHVQQFKQRPIAWHLVSPERTFEAFVLYHKLSRATLERLRTDYAGALIGTLRADLERARERRAAVEVSRLQAQIEDVEEFRERLQKIERGDELKYRIRCRWKGEEETGRPGPYNPDIDDGVKVNIRPFQEAGLLGVREVIKKW